jgi:hypothetical protein
MQQRSHNKPECSSTRWGSGPPAGTTSLAISRERRGARRAAWPVDWGSSSTIRSTRPSLLADPSCRGHWRAISTLGSCLREVRTPAACQAAPNNAFSVHDLWLAGHCRDSGCQTGQRFGMAPPATHLVPQQLTRRALHPADWVQRFSAQDTQPVRPDVVRLPNLGRESAHQEPSVRAARSRRNAPNARHSA